MRSRGSRFWMPVVLAALGVVLAACTSAKPAATNGSTTSYLSVTPGPGVGPLSLQPRGPAWFASITASRDEVLNARSAATPTSDDWRRAVVAVVQKSTRGKTVMVTPLFSSVDGPSYVTRDVGEPEVYDRQYTTRRLVTYTSGEATAAEHSVWVSDPDDELKWAVDGPADAYGQARDAALVLLWRHFGRQPFTYLQTASPSWVIGRRGSDEAGVMLGAFAGTPEGGIGAAVLDTGTDEWASTRVRSGVVVAGGDLGAALRRSGMTVFR